jgi:hypothetical protein
MERKRECYHIIFLKELEILHQETRGQVNTIDGTTVENKGKLILAIVVEHFNSSLFHKSGPANKQHTCQSINTPAKRSSV